MTRFLVQSRVSSGYQHPYLLKSRYGKVSCKFFRLTSKFTRIRDGVGALPLKSVECGKNLKIEYPGIPCHSGNIILYCTLHLCDHIPWISVAREGY